MRKLFWGYLKSRRGTGLLLLLLLAVSALLGWAGGMARAELIYGGLLWLALCTLGLGLGFLRFCRRYWALAGLREQALLSLENLPSPGDPLEWEYQGLLRLLREDRLSAENAAALRYGEMQDYFTLWAHQIKTPISAMRLILQSGGDSTGELEPELFRIEQYVDMVLNYLRMDSDYTDFVIRPCALDGIIRRSVRKFAKQFIRKRIRLRYEGTGAQALTDEKWLGFVLDQLLANALKYTASGWIAIRAGEGEITVEDTGMGIAPEDLPRVFDKGYTGYNGRTDQKSTGIGLYLCKRILGMLGHGIEIESRPGEGTRVRLLLAPEGEGLQKCKIGAESVRQSDGRRAVQGL